MIWVTALTIVSCGYKNNNNNNQHLLTNQNSEFTAVWYKMWITNISEVCRVHKRSMTMPVSVGRLPTFWKCKSAPLSKGPWQTLLFPPHLCHFGHSHSPDPRANLLPLKGLSENRSVCKIKRLKIDMWNVFVYNRSSGGANFTPITVRKLYRA